MSTITTRPFGPADEALIAAERQLAELRRKGDALVAAGDRSDHDEITGPIADLETLICKTAPESLIGVAVKLRQLVDDLQAATGCEGDEQSARQCLAVVERLIAAIGANAKLGRLIDDLEAASGGSQADAGAPAREEISLAALVEKRFRLFEQGEDSTRGLGFDDETIDLITDAMTAAVAALDQRIVDSVPETLDDLSAQLRLYRALGTGGVISSDERDWRLYKSMMAGLARLGPVAAKGGATERPIAPDDPTETNTAPTALNVLEDELANIEGLSEVLVRMGNDGGDNPLVYLGFRLEDHHRAALEAFETLSARARAEGGAA